MRTKKQHTVDIFPAGIIEMVFTEPSMSVWGRYLLMIPVWLCGFKLMPWFQLE